MSRHPIGVSHRVSLTPTARRQADALRGKATVAYGEIVERLAADGCAAADYRLTGGTVNRICALHFYARYRALVCFPEEEHVVIVLIAEHDRGSKDVYGALYEQLGINPPTGKRSKPPCCGEDGEPPIDPVLLDRLVTAAKRLRRTV
jgi:hypothetical protein